MKNKKRTKEKFVTTINNEELPISKCRRYENGFYKIGDSNIENSGDCYLLNDGKYYRFETGQIVFNHSIKKYTLLANSNLTFGIIDADLNTGYFSEDLNTVHTMLEDGNFLPTINKEIIKNNLNFRESYQDSAFYHISKLKANQFYKLKRISKEIKESYPYNSSDVLHKFIETYDQNYVETHEISNDILNIVKDYSFGLEFETIEGEIPLKTCKKLGLIPLRDGSIPGLEYATIPLSGSKGVSTIIDIVKELNLKTKFNDDCALHLHIGNIPRTPSFILAFYRVTCMIQDEIFSMFPLYKKYNFGYKNKNYSAPYESSLNFLKMDDVITEKNLIKNFNILFEELSNGKIIQEYGDTGDLSKIQYHPNDPNNNHKWNIKSRYHIHNLIPLIFGNKKTIEFRIHTPTTDIKKILWFLCFNIMLIDFVKQNEREILNGYRKEFSTLQNIFNIYFYSNNISKQFTHTFVNVMSTRKNFMSFTNLHSKIFPNEQDLKIKFYYLKPSINTKSESLSFYDKFAYYPKNYYKEIADQEYEKKVLEVKQRLESYILNPPNVKPSLVKLGKSAEIFHNDILEEYGKLEFKYSILDTDSIENGTSVNIQNVKNNNTVSF